MHASRGLRYVLIALLMTSFPTDLNGKRLNDEEKGKSNESMKTIVEALSARLFQLAKRDKNSHLPPQIQLTVVIPSNSFIGSRNFNLLKNFARDLVQEFSMSSSGTRVAILTHSSAPRLAFSWYQFMNMECTLKGIASLRFQPGIRSPLDSLLNFAKTKLYSQANNEKNPVHRILFIIAESTALSSEKLTALPKKPHNDSIEVFLLTVGKHVTSNEPNKVASKPFKTHMFRVTSYPDLSRLSRAFKGKGFNHSCSGEGFVQDECNRRCRCKDDHLTDCFRIRKDFISMPLEERRRYVRALKVVSNEAPYKSTYDLITKLHPKFFSIIHEKPFFFPWHRWYLFAFENLLRHVDCRVTVPYWNWARAVSRKRMWRQTDIRDIWNPGSHGLGGNGESRSRCVRTGPFKAGRWSLPSWLSSECLSRNFDHKYYLPGEWYVNYLIKIPWKKFHKFESGVRDYMHNDLHNAVGGTMALDESANAPEFWSHHAFLDNIWSNWQDRGPKYKFAYYRSINRTLPGSYHFGWEFMDLQNQPHCIRVLYEESHDEKIPDGTDAGQDSNREDLIKYYIDNDDDDFDDDDDVDLLISKRQNSISQHEKPDHNVR